MKVADLTVEKFRTLLREVAAEALNHVDPDAGLTLRPEVEERLRWQLEHPEPGRPMDEVMRELGIEPRDDATVKVADLSVDEFRDLVQEVLEESLPDDDGELRPEFAAELRASLANPRPGISSEGVRRRLGLRS